MRTNKLPIFLLLIWIIALATSVSCTRETDTEPPTAPTGISSTVTTTSVTLSWSSSSDNVGVAGYKVYRDGVAAGNATGTNFTDKNLMPNSSYVYTVSAFDAAGNNSKPSLPHTAKTVDDCPTCSKWMTEINFTAPTPGIILAGEEKSAGSLLIKNISSSAHVANLMLTFSGAGAAAVDSLNYVVNGKAVKGKLENNALLLNQISVAANSSTEIKLSYKLKEAIPISVADQSQIALALTATTTDESGVTQPGNRIFPGVNLDKVKAYTAKINSAKSYEASSRAEDKILFGNSVAKAFVLEVVEAGTIRLEIVGKLQNGSSPIKYFWVNGKDDEDFNVSVSTLKPIIAKTSLADKSFIEVSLKAGTNVIAFKTNPYSGQIANGSKVGLKVIGSGFSMENTSYTANSISANLAAIVKVKAQWTYNFFMLPRAYGYNLSWGSYLIYSLTENGNYDEKGYPKIEKMASDASFWAENYPSITFKKVAGSPEGFDQDFRVLGVLFGRDIDERGLGTVFAKELENNVIKYENNIISFAGPAVQTVGFDPGNIYDFVKVETYLNVYNNSDKELRRTVYGFDPYPAGWKFTGNPELELWTHPQENVSKRIL